jgi:ribosomal protein S18 acetylase RimI-like enzyme
MTRESPSRAEVEIMTVSDIAKNRHEALSLLGDQGINLILECPEVESEFPRVFYLRENDGQIICSLKFLPDKLVADDGTEFKWAWAEDLFTHPQHRGRGLATIVTRRSAEILNQKGIAWGGVLSTDSAVRIYRRLNFYNPGYAKRYLMVKTVEPLLNAYINRKSIVRWIGNIFNPIISKVYYKFLKWNRISGIVKTFQELSLSDIKKNENYFPPIKYDCQCHFKDSNERIFWKVNWANSRQGHNCRIYLFGGCDASIALGYMVVRKRVQMEPMAGRFRDFRLMTLMDFGFFKLEENAYLMLLHSILKLFWQGDADVLEVITNNIRLQNLARHLGLIRIGKGMSFTYSVPRDWNWPNNYNNIRSMHLTHFCGDGFTF